MSFADIKGNAHYFINFVRDTLADFNRFSLSHSYIFATRYLLKNCSVLIYTTSVLLMISGVCLYFLAPDGIRQLLTGFLIGVALYLMRLPREISANPFVIRNYSLADRIEKITQLVSKCEKELVIYSGEFNHFVYNSDRVMSALDKLPDNVKITFYISEQNIDPKSHRLLKYIKERNLKVITDVNKQHLKHFIVVDRKHVRVTHTPHADHSKDRYATFYYYRPGLAKKVMNSFQKEIAA